METETARRARESAEIITDLAQRILDELADMEAALREAEAEIRAC